MIYIEPEKYPCDSNNNPISGYQSLVGNKLYSSLAMLFRNPESGKIQESIMKQIVPWNENLTNICRLVW